MLHLTAECTIQVQHVVANVRAQPEDDPHGELRQRRDGPLELPRDPRPRPTVGVRDRPLRAHHERDVLPPRFESRRLPRHAPSHLIDVDGERVRVDARLGRRHDALHPVHFRLDVPRPAPAEGELLIKVRSWVVHEEISFFFEEAERESGNVRDVRRCDIIVCVRHRGKTRSKSSAIDDAPLHAFFSNVSKKRVKQRENSLRWYPAPRRHLGVKRHALP